MVSSVQHAHQGLVESLTNKEILLNRIFIFSNLYLSRVVCIFFLVLIVLFDLRYLQGWPGARWKDIIRSHVTRKCSSYDINYRQYNTSKYKTE